MRTKTAILNLNFEEKTRNSLADSQQSVKKIKSISITRQWPQFNHFIWMNEGSYLPIRKLTGSLCTHRTRWAAASTSLSPSRGSSPTCSSGPGSWRPTRSTAKRRAAATWLATSCLGRRSWWSSTGAWLSTPSSPATEEPCQTFSGLWSSDATNSLLGSGFSSASWQRVKRLSHWCQTHNWLFKAHLSVLSVGFVCLLRLHARFLVVALWAEGL